MKKWLQEFWTNPVKRRSFIIINLIMFAVFFSAFHLLDKQINAWVSLVLVSLALLCEILVFAFYVPDQLKEIWQDIKALIAWSNRDAIYHHYRLKHEDKDYKGPDWEDEEFKKISDLKKRIDEFVKVSIAYQKIDFERWKKRNLGVNLDHQSQTAQRIIKVAIATFISLFILCILYKWLKFDSDTISTLIKDSRSPVVAALITTIITSPVIFIIWVFKDKNNRIQIENTRKDTNLKDFQKLSEWASGFHLPEIKQTTSTKSISKTGKDGQENTEETTTSQEDFIAPEGSNSISRRQGAEALQASAIAQLEAFMFGKYGEQFMQPAFLLIHATWESIITQHQVRYPNEQEFKKSLFELHKNPIVAALNRALAGASGNHLKLFKNNLQGINLSGLTSDIYRLKPLMFAGYNLAMANLSYVEFWEANFTGANLRGIRLFKANLTFSDFKGSDLKNSNLMLADLMMAKLQGVNLSYSNLKQSDLSAAKLQSANLTFTKLQGAILSFTELQGADLRQANLINTELKDATIDKYTAFGDYDKNKKEWVNENQIREDVLSRGAIWDDDPEWLVGKIQDQALLEKIFQDCEERQKN